MTNPHLVLLSHISPVVLTNGSYRASDRTDPRAVAALLSPGCGNLHSRCEDVGVSTQPDSGQSSSERALKRSAGLLLVAVGLWTGFSAVAYLQRAEVDSDSFMWWWNLAGLPLAAVLLGLGVGF